jgi:hypothetical protein
MAKQMAKKNERAFYTCPTFKQLREAQYDSVAEASRGLGVSDKTLAKLENGKPLARATILKVLRVYKAKHDPALNFDERIVDTRTAAG